MRNKGLLKIIIRVMAVITVTACIWIVTDKILPVADFESTAVNIEILPAGVAEYLPAAVRNFELNLKQSENTEMLKHYDVRGKGNFSKIYGYVQIWKSEQSLKHYLNISKEYMSANVFGFREEDIKTNGISWKKWEYIVNGISVLQGFREENGTITMCSLCVPYQERSYAFDKLFLEVLQNVITQA